MKIQEKFSYKFYIILQLTYPSKNLSILHDLDNSLLNQRFVANIGFLNKIKHI